MFYHRQQDPAGGFGVGLGVMVGEIVADVSGESVESVVRQVGPDAAGELTGAGVFKIWTGKAEVLQRLP